MNDRLVVHCDVGWEDGGGDTGDVGVERGLRADKEKKVDDWGAVKIVKNMQVVAALRLSLTLTLTLTRMRDD